MNPQDVLEVFWGDDIPDGLPPPLVVYILEYAGIVRRGSRSVQIMFYVPRPVCRFRRLPPIPEAEHPGPPIAH